MPNPLDPPAHLDDARRAIWRDTLAQIMEAGTIARLDPNSLAAYVEAVHTHQRATHLLAQTDILINREGTPAPNPALHIQQTAARTIATFARQFRLTATAPGQPDHTEQPDQGKQSAQPMRDGAPMRKGRWCERHSRYCCTGTTQAGLPCCRPARKTSGKCPRHDTRGRAVKLAESLGLVPTYGLPVKVTAEQAVMEELWRTAGAVRWLAERVAQLEAAALTWGTTQTVQRWWGEFPGSEEVAKAGPHVLLDLYFRERKHLVDVALGIIGAGLAARMVDLAQEQGAASARVVDAILADLSLTEEQWALVPQVVPRRFRELMPA